MQKSTKEKEIQCPLCRNTGNLFYQSKKRNFFECTRCTGIFVDQANLLEKEEEKERYDHHSDDINNQGYRNSVNPTVSEILKNFTTTDKGLDFGCGKSEIVAKLLQERGYDIVGYDPFYKPQKETLQHKYDYITACEVVEHFNNPEKEFLLLKSLLKSRGKLILQTNIFTSNIDFGNWWYKNDATHVFFYTPQCLQFVGLFLDFNSIEIGDNLIVFSL